MAFPAIRPAAWLLETCSHTRPTGPRAARCAFRRALAVAQGT